MRPTFAGTTVLIACSLYTASTAAITCGASSNVGSCGGNGNSPCPIIVAKDANGAWSVTPYNLIVSKPNRKLLFVLLGDAKFVDGKGEGLAAVVHGKNQFDDQYPTDKFDPNPPKKSEGQIWHVKFSNTGNEANDIKYSLTFEDANGQVTCDPLINNSGGGPRPVHHKKRPKRQ